MLLKSIDLFKTCWNKYNNRASLWGLAFNYALLGNCSECNDWLDKYLSEIEKHKEQNQIDYNQVDLLRNKCSKN